MMQTVHGGTLGNLGKHSSSPAPLSLDKKRQWIADCVAPTLKMIQLADENLDEAFLTEVIEQAELKPHQIKLVEDYLIGRAEMEKTHQDKEEVI